MVPFPNVSNFPSDSKTCSCLVNATIALSRTGIGVGTAVVEIDVVVYGTGLDRDAVDVTLGVVVAQYVLITSRDMESVGTAETGIVVHLASMGRHEHGYTVYRIGAEVAIDLYRGARGDLDPRGGDVPDCVPVYYALLTAIQGDTVEGIEYQVVADLDMAGGGDKDPVPVTDVEIDVVGVADLAVLDQDVDVDVRDDHAVHAVIGVNGQTFDDVAVDRCAIARQRMCACICRHCRVAVDRDRRIRRCCVSGHQHERDDKQHSDDSSKSELPQ